MSFRDDVLAHYLDSDGMITIDRDPSKWSTGNGLLHCGIFYTMLALTGEVKPKDLERFIKTVTNCQIQKGLYSRDPGRPDLEAHDDRVGISAASYHLKAPFAADIVQYGKTNCWSYNNVSPGKFTLRTWDFRFPGLTAFYRTCAGEQIGWFDRLVLTNNIRVNGRLEKTEATAKILTFLQITVLKGKHSAIDNAIADWNKSLIENYGSLNALFAAYFGDDHPLSKTNFII